MPTTNEMTNRAIQELTELAPHSAFAKIIDKSVGEEGVWKGKIKTCKLVDVPTEMERDYQLLRDISIQTVQHYGTKRVVIEEELRKRRERWRKGSPPKEPSGGPPSGWG